jgi:cytoskeletal protein RodZ
MLKTTLQIKTLGTLLIEKRKEKGLELKDVSQIIKIRSTYLSALEEGHYEVFSSEVYLTGFLKNYAKFLGIDSEKIMAMYRRENERKNTDSNMNMITKLKKNNFNFILTPNKIVALLAGLAILIILLYLGNYVGKVLKKPMLVLTSPVSVTQEGEAAYRTDANFIELTGTAEIGSKLTINAQELKLNNFEKFTQEFKLEEGSNVFAIKAENQFGRDTTITLTITKGVSALQESPTPTPVPKSMAISIEIVKKDTNLTVTIDGEVKTDRLYKIGSLLEFTAFKSFVLTTANQPSVLLKINGVAETVGTVNSWTIVNNEIVKN